MHVMQHVLLPRASASRPPALARRAALGALLLPLLPLLPARAADEAEWALPADVGLLNGHLRPCKARSAPHALFARVRTCACALSLSRACAARVLRPCWRARWRALRALSHAARCTLLHACPRAAALTRALTLTRARAASHAQAGTACVSTSYGSAPGNAMPPWRLEGSPERRAALYARVRSAALATGAAAPYPGVVATRVLAETPTRYLSVAQRRADGDTDVFEFLFLQAEPAAVCFRAAGAQRRRDPPFCAQRGCVNGPAQRARLDALRDALDVSPLDTDEDKAWVPLLLH
jgi:hypothetical protein